LSTPDASLTSAARSADPQLPLGSSGFRVVTSVQYPDTAQGEQVNRLDGNEAPAERHLVRVDRNLIWTDETDATLGAEIAN
jgi:hypothetical protein